MSVTVYSSTDAGAPVLSGSVGSFIALLDAVLVTGYGTKAAVGWTKPFTGVNLAAYKMPAGTTGHYLRVNDTVTTRAGVVGFETMTDVNTGTGQFPTEAQNAGGLFIQKSASASALNRPWFIVTNGSMLHIYPDYSSDTLALFYSFGSFPSYKSADAANTFIMADSSPLSGNTASIVISIIQVILGHYIARSYTQLPGAVAAGKLTDSPKCNNASTMGATGVPFPSPIDNGLYIAPIYINESNVLRGVLPGMWNICHNRPGVQDDTFSGTGALAGKTFMIKKIYNGSIAFEISNTW